MKRNKEENPMMVNLEDANLCAQALRKFKSNSLTGMKIHTGSSYIKEIDMNPLMYEHFGNSSPRHRFFVFECFLHKDLVAYVVLTQKHPLIWLDRFGVWHLIGATRSNVAKRHEQFMKNLAEENCFVYELQKVIAAGQTENEEIKEYTEASVAEYLMELAEDKKFPLDSLLF